MADSVILYRTAAEQGQADAYSDLGFLLEDGQGGAKDDAEAVIWSRKAESRWSVFRSAFQAPGPGRLWAG